MMMKGNNGVQRHIFHDQQYVEKIFISKYSLYEKFLY